MPEPPDSVTAAGTVVPATANEPACVSRTPGSVKDAASETGWPTKTTAPGAGAVIFTAGATFRMGTAIVAIVVPPSLSVTWARAVTPGSSIAGQTVDGVVEVTKVPAPQSKAIAKPAAVSAAESLIAAASVKVAPSLTGDGVAVSVTAGGTFAIVSVVTAFAHAPWSSQTVSVTGTIAGPSGTVIVASAPVALTPPTSHAYVSVSPSASVAEPCSVNAVFSPATYGPPAEGTGGSLT